jgi:type I restriction enzyme S subunit
MSLPAYSNYQNSGTPWLGNVPVHWAIRRLGYFFDERREKVSDRDYQPLSVTKFGIVPQLETAAKTDDGDNRKLVRTGDFVINSRSDRKGSAGASALDGSVSLINTVLCPTSEIDISFAHHLLRSVPFQEEYYRFGKGIVADLWSTNYSEMRNITLAVPSISEQRAIATFLGHETNKIDALIAEQEKLVTLLAEKRQATISRAVTHGLDPDAPMKDSGVEWLGKVPAHWMITRIKRLITLIEQGWSPQCENFSVEGAQEWGVMKVGCVNGGLFNASENKKLPLELTPIPAYSLRSGDLLISRANTRELVGSAAVVPQDFEHLLLCDKLYRLRTNLEACMPEFLAAFLSIPAARAKIELEATGASSSMLNIAQSVILELSVPLPEITEQSAIMEFIDAETNKFDALKSKAERAIHLLKERRSAVIAAAVTGKIDVRDAVPQELAA